VGIDGARRNRAAHPDGASLVYPALEAAAL
jgi:hypothetical protein